MFKKKGQIHMEHPDQVIYDNVVSHIPRVELVNKYSKKTNKYYPFLILHFRGVRYTKTIFLDDLETLLFEKMKNKVDEEDNFLNNERGL